MRFRWVQLHDKPGTRERLGVPMGLSIIQASKRGPLRTSGPVGDDRKQLSWMPMVGNRLDGLRGPVAAATPCGGVETCRRNAMLLIFGA